MKNTCVAGVCFVVSLFVVPIPAMAQGTVQSRLDTLERKVERLQERVDNLSERLAAERDNRIERDAALKERDAALRARVAKLEGRHLTAADFVGAYTINNLALALDGDPNTLVSYVATGTATFAADGTGTIAATFVGVGITEGAPNQTWTHSAESEGATAPFTFTYSGGVLLDHDRRRRPGYELQRRCGRPGARQRERWCARQ